MNITRSFVRHLGQRAPFSTAHALARSAPLDIHPEVEEALATNKPVVALETTLITHGIPYHTNYHLAISLEDIVRSTGAIPATIGIIEGRVKVGMEKLEVERLANNETYPNKVKVSRRDIGPMISAKLDGGTTCSATLIFAAMAGIKVFATGGLGGVHRNGESTMDVSADLFELTRCPVGLVSSGVKSILDIGRTLEYLETLGVPVVTYGPTCDFPAFFTRYSGFQVPYSIETPAAAARLLHTQWQFGMENGALIAVPIPEEYQAVGSSIQRAVDQAVEESEANGISQRGKEVTPWLLDRVVQLTGGDSLTSNIALLKNTALVGGQIAVEYQLLQQNISSFSMPVAQLSSPMAPSVQLCSSSPGPARLAIIGCSAVDVTAKASKPSDQALATHSTVPGSIQLSLGGVARNVAEASHRVSSDSSATVLISPIGNDSFGNLLLKETQNLGMRTDGLIGSDTMRTAVCNMLLSEDGQLVTGVADMDITAHLSGKTIVQSLIRHQPYLVAFDGNLSAPAVQSLLEHCHSTGLNTFFEPTSLAKSTVVLPAIGALCQHWGLKAPITFASPNILELQRIYHSSREEPFELMSKSAWWKVIDALELGSAYRMDLEKIARMNVSPTSSSKGTLSFLIDKGIAGMAVNLLPFIQHIIIKCGDLGVIVVMHISRIQNSGWRKSALNKRYIVAEGSRGHGVVIMHIPPLPIERIRNVTGAGDSFVGVLLRLLQDTEATRHPEALERIVNTAQEAAILTLQSERAVAPTLSELLRV